MDAVRRRPVLHVVASPVVEDPGLPRSHVHHAAVAVEAHGGLGDHRDVQADAGMPVVVDVRMLRHAHYGGQAHQPRAAPDHAEARQHLAQIRHRLKPSGRTHLAPVAVGLGPTRGDQPDSAVAGDPVRMRRPGHIRKRGDLGLQAGGVEQDW